MIRRFINQHLYDRSFGPRRIGNHDITGYFELRSFGLLFRWSAAAGLMFFHLGPFGCAIELNYYTD